jgi:hypothetical protein
LISPRYPYHNAPVVCQELRQISFTAEGNATVNFWGAVAAVTWRSRTFFVRAHCAVLSGINDPGYNISWIL